MFSDHEIANVRVFRVPLQVPFDMFARPCCSSPACSGSSLPACVPRRSSSSISSHASPEQTTATPRMGNSAEPSVSRAASPMLPCFQSLSPHTDPPPTALARHLRRGRCHRHFSYASTSHTERCASCKSAIDAPERFFAMRFSGSLDSSRLSATATECYFVCYFDCMFAAHETPRLDFDFSCYFRSVTRDCISAVTTRTPNRDPTPRPPRRCHHRRCRCFAVLHQK